MLFLIISWSLVGIWTMLLTFHIKNRVNEVTPRSFFIGAILGYFMVIFGVFEWRLWCKKEKSKC
jgi:hypothetical protein